MDAENRTILAIWNRGKQGKTTSIRNAAKVVRDWSTTTHASNPIPDEGEVSTVLTISLPAGPVKVAFESRGDPNTGLEERLDRIAREGASIIVTATRTDGKTVAAVEGVANEHDYHVLWQSSLTSGTLNEAVLNDIMGRHIAYLVEQLIAGAI